MKENTGIRTEAHFHTSQVSRCAKVPAEALVEAYAQAGYGGIIVTDHLDPETALDAQDAGMTLQDWYLQGYHAACKAAEPHHMRIFLGMELRMTVGLEDYLIYGLTEEIFRKMDVENITNWPLKQVYAHVKELGLMLYQAHPFRSYLNAANPRYLDGAEVYNGNPRHDSHNAKALAWAKSHDLSWIAGSDAHQFEDVGLSGILLPEQVRTGTQLGDYLRETPEPAFLHA